jgi:hypothetical protein
MRVEGLMFSCRFHNRPDQVTNVYGRCIWKGCISAVESRSHCLCQARSFNRKALGQDPNIEEVLHPTISDPEQDHCVKLFCDDRLPRVRINNRSRKVKKGRIRNSLRLRPHRITNSNVNLHGNPRNT